MTKLFLKLQTPLSSFKATHKQREIVG